MKQIYSGGLNKKNEEPEMRIVLTSLLTLLLSLALYSCGAKKEEAVQETVVEKAVEIKTVQIGNQIWTAENLNVKTDSGSWVYNDEEANGGIYGRLYNWETAQKLCPAGWRLPTEEDWILLIKHYGTYDVAGAKFKSAELWTEPSSGNSEQNSLKALPGGMRNSSDSYFGLKFSGYYWTATERGAESAMYIGLDYDKTEVLQEPQSKKYGFSVRYIKI